MNLHAKKRRRRKAQRKLAEPGWRYKQNRWHGRRAFAVCRLVCILHPVRQVRVWLGPDPRSGVFRLMTFGGWEFPPARWETIGEAS